LSINNQGLIVVEREPEVVSENIFPAPEVCDRFRFEFAWRFVSPFVTRSELYRF